MVYFCALMCTHLAAFRTATNIRKRCMAHLAKAPLGYFDTHASGLLRRRIDGAAAQTETLLAHNLADITGTIAMFVTLLVLLLVFDWRMGARLPDGGGHLRRGALCHDGRQERQPHGRVL